MTPYSIYPLLYLLGLLFGIALFRARIVPRWAARPRACSGPLAIIMVTLLPHQPERLAALPMGFALAWLGYRLWAERRASDTKPISGRAGAEPGRAAAP